MKIALLMSGHARTYDRTFHGWNDYLLSKYDVDVFLDLWDTLGHRDNVQDGRDNLSGVIDTKAVDVNNICDIWNPVSIHIEKYDNILHEYFRERAKEWYRLRDEFNLRKIDRPLANFSMWYKWKSAFRLLRDDYDLVIRTRPDVILRNTLPPEVFLDPSYVYIPIAGSWGGDEISDYMTIGTQEQIQKICNLYDDLDKMKKWAVKIGDFTKVLYPHKMLHYYMDVMINLSYKQINIDCEIVR